MKKKHMNFKTEFIQICFCNSADFIQPSFLLFCDVVIGWSLSRSSSLNAYFPDCAWKGKTYLFTFGKYLSKDFKTLHCEIIIRPNKYLRLVQ